MTREEIAKNLSEVSRIDLEADSIARVIQKLALMDQDSRQKVLDTVQAYYELNLDAWPDQLKAMQDRMAAENEQLKKRVEDARPLRGAIPRYSDPEEIELRGLVDAFSRAMLNKMLEKHRVEGYEGWDEPSISNMDELWESLEDHVKKGSDEKNLVDIANFCAFLWNLRSKSG